MQAIDSLGDPDQCLNYVQQKTNPVGCFTVGEEGSVVKSVSKAFLVSLTRAFSVFVLWSLNRFRFFATPWTVAHQASLSFTISQSLLKPMSIESVMPSNHVILCRPFSSCLQFFPASRSFPMSQFFASGGLSISILRVLRRLAVWKLV